MHTKIRKIKAREVWIQTYEKLGSVSKAARRCGIPRSTLYRWIKRYKDKGLEGLLDKSQRPNRLGKLKTTTEVENLIINIRQNHRFGPKRISLILLRDHAINLSKVATLNRTDSLN